VILISRYESDHDTALGEVPARVWEHVSTVAADVAAPATYYIGTLHNRAEADTEADERHNGRSLSTRRGM